MDAPRTLQDYIATLREGLVCDRCGRYVGSLSAKRYLPPQYAVAVSSIADDAKALVAFEWHMLGLLRRGNFVIRHPEIDGACVSYREWLADGEEDDEDG